MDAMVQGGFPEVGPLLQARSAQHGMPLLVPCLACQHVQSSLASCPSDQGSMDVLPYAVYPFNTSCVALLRTWHILEMSVSAGMKG